MMCSCFSDKNLVGAFKVKPIPGHVAKALPIIGVHHSQIFHVASQQPYSILFVVSFLCEIMSMQQDTVDGRPTSTILGPPRAGYSMVFGTKPSL